MAENEKPRESTRLYKELFSHIETGLAILCLENCDDPRSLRLIAANPAARRAAGIGVEECEGKLLVDTAPKLFKTGIAQACAEVVRRGQARDLGQIQSGDEGISGAVFAVKVRPLPDDCAAVIFEDITEHKRPDEAVQIHERLTELPQAMIAVVDRDYRYLLTNSAFLKYRVMSREQVVGRSVSEVLGKEVFEGVIKKYLDACFQGEAVQYVMRRTYPDLGERELLVSYIPIEGPAGVDRVASVIHDITERRRVQEALEQAVKRFELASLATQDALYDWDLVSHEIWRNENYQRLFGAPERSLDSDNWWLEHLHPNDRERVLTAQQAALGGGLNLFSLEFRLRRPDGSYAQVVARSLMVRDARGQVVRMIGALTDVTERKQAEEALRESEERFRSLVENATVGIYRTTPDGHILMANPTLVRLLGFNSTEELAARNLECEGFASSYPRSAFRERIEREGQVIGLESAWVRRDGAVIFIRESARVVRAGDGRTLYYDGIVEDITERKRAQEASRESEERYRSLVENSPVGIYRTTADGRILAGNPAFAQMLGCSSFEELASRNLNTPDFEPQYSRGQFTEKLEKEGRITGLESQWRRRDGSVISVRENARAIRDEAGRILYYEGTAEDITERRRAEEALRESEARFRTVFENAGIGMGLVDMQGHSIETNLATQKMLGYSGLELKQMPYTQYTHPDDAQVTWDMFRELAEGKRDRYHLEKRYLRKDGQLLWGRLTQSLVRNQKGEPQYAIAMLEDITDRKRAEEAQRESEARFRAIFENAGIGIALEDMRGHPVESNPAFRKMLGYSGLELAQMAFTQFTHPADAQADWNLFAELVEGKRDQYQLEKRFCRKDGEVVWGQLTVSPIRNRNGELQYAVKMVEDVTERKRAAEALRQLSGRILRLQDEERRRIARELHDTTAQSLTALALNLSVVKDSAPDLSARARICLSESLELAEECSREIRTLSYLLHPPLLDEAGLGLALRWFVDGYAQRTGIHVDLEMPTELTRLPGDIELALYRLVQEGLTNIRLHSGSKKAHVCLKCGPDQAVLTVADEGRGLPPGLLERGDPRAAKRGVGISGMRERIRQLGGQFEIVTGGNGTTVTAVVPLREEPA